MEQTREAFADLVAPGAGELAGDLDHAALLIARAIDTAVDVNSQLRRLDELAASCTAGTPGELAIELFGGIDRDPDRHFVGNQSAYYDAENSLLHRVLDRRVGIPITLSVLFIAVAKRRGISAHGVGMPGHFLVGFADGFIDPFHGGLHLDEQACGRLFQTLAGPNAALPHDALVATPPAHIIKRMLFNLSAIGANQQQRRTLRAVRSLLAAFPDASHRDHVQHAYAAAAIGQYGEAATAGESALETIPSQVYDKLAAQVDTWRAQLN